MKNEMLFTKSADFKDEYCIRVVKIGEFIPISGKDRIVQVVVDGFTMIVGKNEVNEGDYMFYAMNQVQLNSIFLHKNNLYSLSERDLNSNAEELNTLVNEGKSDYAKTKCGYFNKRGVVKMLKLGGVSSLGFLFGKEAMAKFSESVGDIDLSEYEGVTFDTVNGTKFAKMYIPEVTYPSGRGNKRSDKRKERMKKFDIILPEHFDRHYDTCQLNCNMHRFNPDDKVTISVKIHGTSVIIGNILVKKPIQCSIASRMVAKKIKHLAHYYDKKKATRYHEKRENLKKNVFYNVRIPKEFNIGYGNVYSSRNVIQNQYINPKKRASFYETDVYGKYNNLIKKYIPEGMTIYGEIFGYNNDKPSMIQSGFDYGCEVGTNKLMIYRISVEDKDGNKKEWEVEDVYKWTLKLVKEHQELKEYIHPIDILYNGTLKNLYPEIDTETHWNENVLAAMKNDKEHFGMEQLEPMCKNKVWREGVVVRINNDEKVEAFKLKCANFLYDEMKAVEKGNVNFDY